MHYLTFVNLTLLFSPHTLWILNSHLYIDLYFPSAYLNASVLIYTQLPPPYTFSSFSHLTLHAYISLHFLPALSSCFSPSSSRSPDWCKQTASISVLYIIQIRYACACISESPSQPLTRCADRGFTICETHTHTFVHVYKNTFTRL